MFSPYYAAARRRDPNGLADPLDHCAINVVLYGRGGSRWAMTERGRARVDRSRDHLQIGPSAMRWEGDGLVIDIDELTVPWPRRLRGRVQVRPVARIAHAVSLAPGHWWCPIAPVAHVDVDVGGHRWSGRGYLDSNQGRAPLERAFRRWDWSRSHLRNGDCAVFYDVERVDAEPLHVGLRFGIDGRVATVDRAPAAAPVANTRWRVARGARSDPHASVQVRRTLTDAPFYARSLLGALWFGEPVSVMHESLSLDRFDNRLVQAMLPFRMPRRAR